MRVSDTLRRQDDVQLSAARGLRFAPPVRLNTVEPNHLGDKNYD